MGKRKNKRGKEAGLLTALPPSPPAKAKRRTGARNYAGAQHSRLTADWQMFGNAADVYLRQGLKGLVTHSQELARNNDYMRQFLLMVRRNVVGAKGIVLRMQCRDGKGGFDRQVNALVESVWAEWGKKGNCTVCGRLSWLQVQWVTSVTVPRDGELLVRMVRGFPNKWGFALQLIEGAHLDVDLNRPLPDGGEIRMGVEMNVWGRPVAYHILTRHPGLDTQQAAKQRYERIPAEDILHLGIPEYTSGTQTRFPPWCHSAMRRLKMVGGYEEAALVAARAGAAKMGFFTEAEGSSYNGIEDDDPSIQSADQSPDGDLINDAEPGHFERLPPGVDFKEFNPDYPSGEMGPFMKIVLRGAAAGLGVSYNSLAKDLEGVNYSSMRAGTLEDRDEFQIIQQWMAEDLHSPIHAAWLEQSLLTGALPLEFSDLDRLTAGATWQPRGWPWVDPKNDAEANTRAGALGVKSRTEMAAERGRNIEDVFAELAHETKLAAEMGVDLPEIGLLAGAAAPGGAPPSSEEE